MAGNSDGATQCDAKTIVGFDGTGRSLFVVYRATDIVLPHGNGIARFGTWVPPIGPLEPGDVLLFGGTKSAYDHVGIYAGGGYNQIPGLPA